MQKTAGLRDSNTYRDLGIAAATNGLAQAQVIRMIAPFRPELSVRHHHNVHFQMVQPPGIRHTVVGWSVDCELLELLMPAEHETVNDP